MRGLRIPGSIPALGLSLVFLVGCDYAHQPSGHRPTALVVPVKSTVSFGQPPYLNAVLTSIRAATIPHKEYQTIDKEKTPVWDFDYRVFASVEISCTVTNSAAFPIWAPPVGKIHLDLCTEHGVVLQSIEVDAPFIQSGGQSRVTGAFWISEYELENAARVEASWSYSL
jgi:hypothetical protein